MGSNGSLWWGKCSLGFGVAGGRTMAVGVLVESRVSGRGGRTGSPVGSRVRGTRGLKCLNLFKKTQWGFEPHMSQLGTALIVLGDVLSSEPQY